MVTVIKCFDSCSNNDSDTFDGNPQCNNGYCHNLTSVYRCHINETNIMNQVILAITIIIIIIIKILIIIVIITSCSLVLSSSTSSCVDFFISSATSSSALLDLTYIEDFPKDNFFLKFY